MNNKVDRGITILQMMTPDMVECVAAAINQYGAGASTAVYNTDKGVARPLALLSDEYISDADFPSVAVGFSTLMLSALRQVTGTREFFEKAITSAFSVPTELARRMADQIATSNIIKPDSLTPEAQERVKKYLRSIPSDPWSIGILNRSVAVMDELGDIDFLYELKLLGDAAMNLNSMIRLMKGQSAMAASAKILPANWVSAVDVKAAGDVYGDITSDDAALAAVMGDVYAPLVGNPLPARVLGAFRDLGKLGPFASALHLKKVTDDVGAERIKDVAEGNTQDGYARMLVSMMDKGVSPTAIKEVAAFFAQLRDQLAPVTGDVYDDVAQLYGDTVAECWREGDLPGMMKAVTQLAADDSATTGYADTDKAVEAEVGDVFANYHDPESLDYDREIGGLFGSAAARHAKKARRIQRRTYRQSQKQGRKDARLARSQENRQFVDDTKGNFEYSELPRREFMAAGEEGVRLPEPSQDYQDMSQDEIFLDGAANNLGE